ncbi:MAG: 2-keto-4-pentenoate hydratase, partial [Gammaproteobacteria bacterium]
SGLTGSGREAVTADCGANIAFAYGSPVSYKPELNLADQTCRAFINHHQVAKGNGSNALDDPLNVLVWLANHLSRRGITLEAGAIVTTGTCTGLTDVKAGDHVAGDFGVLGRVDAMLTALG